MYLSFTPLNCPPTEQRHALHVRFDTAGGRIGRNNSCELQLHDPQRLVSREHAEIRYRDGLFSLKVISAVNPVRINETLVNPGGAMQLASGDRVLIGEYLFEVTVADEAAVEIPPRPNPALKEAGAIGPGAFSTNDSFSQLSEASSSPRGVMDQEALKGPSIGGPSWAPEGMGHILGLDGMALGAQQFDNCASERSNSANVLYRAHDFDLPFATPASKTEKRETVSDGLPVPDVFSVLEREFGGQQPADRDTPFPGPDGKGGIVEPDGPSPLPESQCGRRASLPAGAAVSPHANAVHVLTEALGLQPGDLDETRSAETLHLAGELLKISLGGLFRLLEMRSQVKNELRVEDRTMIAVRENNPLKHAGGIEQALKYLLDVRQHGKDKQFMAPRPAVEEAVWDVWAHELAVMAGTRAALGASLKLFAPQAIEGRIKKTGALEAVVPALYRSKLWEHFLELHSALEREAEDHFDVRMNEEFSRAYSEQSRSLRRER